MFSRPSKGCCSGELDQIEAGHAAPVAAEALDVPVQLRVVVLDQLLVVATRHQVEAALAVAAAGVLQGFEQRVTAVAARGVDHEAGAAGAAGSGKHRCRVPRPALGPGQGGAAEGAGGRLAVLTQNGHSHARSIRGRFELRSSPRARLAAAAP